MTIVNQTGGDVNVSPLAFNDAYNAVGNTLLEVGNATSADRAADERRRAA